MNNLILKIFQKEDILALQSLAINTFRETYSENTEANDMEKYIQNAFHLDTLEKELINPQSLYYGIVFENKPLAYMKLNLDTQTDFLIDKSKLEIQRIYVSKDFQGKALGSLLIQKAESIAIEYNRDFIWLVVWAENKNAIQFYEKKQFKIVGTVPFQLGDTIHKDYCMIKSTK